MARILGADLPNVVNLHHAINRRYIVSPNILQSKNQEGKPDSRYANYKGRLLSSFNRKHLNQPNAPKYVRDIAALLKDGKEVYFTWLHHDEETKEKAKLENTPELVSQPAARIITIVEPNGIGNTTIDKLGPNWTSERVYSIDVDFDYYKDYPITPDAHIVNGEILKSPAQTYVIPVNCKGIMGLGLSKEIAKKENYGEACEPYINMAKEGKIQVGKLMFVQLSNGKNLVFFPTREDIKDTTNVEHIAAGLQDFLARFTDYKVESVSLPLLGAQFGRLNPIVATDIICQYLGGIGIPVYIHREYGNPDIICDEVQRQPQPDNNGQQSLPLTGTEPIPF